MLEFKLNNGSKRGLIVYNDTVHIIVLDLLLPLITQSCSHALGTYGEISRGVNSCFGVYSIESVSKMSSILPIIFFIFLIIYWPIYVQLTHSTLDDPEDIFVIDFVIMIRLEISIFFISSTFSRD